MPRFFVIQITFVLFSSIYFFVQPDFIAWGLVGLSHKCLTVQLATSWASPVAVCMFSVRKCRADIQVCKYCSLRREIQTNGKGNMLVGLGHWSTNQALRIEY